MSCPFAASGCSGEDSVSSVPDALPIAGPDTDWRAYRARLAALEAGASSQASSSTKEFSDSKWAHAVPVPETGCVLLAHPSMFGVSLVALGSWQGAGPCPRLACCHSDTA